MGLHIKADKGYKSAKNDQILKDRNLKNGIIQKKKKAKQDTNLASIRKKNKEKRRGEYEA